MVWELRYWYSWQGYRDLFFLDTKKNGEAWGDLEGMIHPVFRCSSKNSLQV